MSFSTSHLTIDQVVTAMGLWLSTRAKCLALLGNNKPGHGGYDMLADRLAAEGKGHSVVATDRDEATSQHHHNSEISGMASHLKERIKLLHALRDFHNARQVIILGN